MSSSKAKVVAKHSNTGQVVRLSESDEVGPSNAAAVSFFDKPTYIQDPETGESFLDRPGAWFTIVNDPCRSIYRRWNEANEEDLPTIPQGMGTGPAVAESWHPLGKRMKICCSCGRYSHPSETGLISMYNHLSHVFVFAGECFREPGWYCSEWCRSKAQDFVRGTQFCKQYEKSHEEVSQEPVPVKHKLPVGAAGPSSGTTKASSTRVVLHATKHVDSWADA